MAEDVCPYCEEALSRYGNKRVCSNFECVANSAYWGLPTWEVNRNKLSTLRARLAEREALLGEAMAFIEEYVTPDFSCFGETGQRIKSLRERAR